MLVTIAPVLVEATRCWRKRTWCSFAGWRTSLLVCLGRTWGAIRWLNYWYGGKVSNRRNCARFSMQVWLLLLCSMFLCCIVAAAADRNSSGGFVHRGARHLWSFFASLLQQGRVFFTRLIVILHRQNITPLNNLFFSHDLLYTATPLSRLPAMLRCLVRVSRKLI